jgi:hypothetical protein
MLKAKFHFGSNSAQTVELSKSADSAQEFIDQVKQDALKAQIENQSIFDEDHFGPDFAEQAADVQKHMELLAALSAAYTKMQSCKDLLD